MKSHELQKRGREVNAKQPAEPRLQRPANFGDTLPPESAANLRGPISICASSHETFGLKALTSKSPTLRLNVVKATKIKAECPTAAEARKGACAHLHDVLRATAVIEAILLSEFSGKGLGIHSKLDSCRPRIPEELDRRLRYIGAVRNKAAYDPSYNIPDKQAFLSMCDQATSELVLLTGSHQRLRKTQGHTRFGAVLRQIKGLLSSTGPGREFHARSKASHQPCLSAIGNSPDSARATVQATLDGQV